VQERLGFMRFLRDRTGAASIRRAPALAATLLGLATAPALALPSSAIPADTARAEQPALWVISDADTTIYLFGTFHALDARTDWFGRTVKAAFDSSDQLVLETIVPSDPAELQAILARHSLGSPLVAGAPVIAAAGSGTFVASAGQAMTAGRSIGMTIDHGADAVLRRAAEASGKPVNGLESFDFQLTMFANLPGTPAAFRAAAGPGIDLPAQLLAMRSAWRRGDAGRFSAVLGSVKAQSPATYQALFSDRNGDWARWIARRMEQPGTVFVAVGTGHLIGADSVQRKLAAGGIRATRIS
jgi:uncharacterized protein YbaP (TraB family)